MDRRYNRVVWCVGCPRSGKTTTALAWAAKIQDETRNPVLVLDASEVRQLAHVRRVHTLHEAARSMWEEPRASCSFVPTDLSQVDAAARMIRAGKDATLLVDEANVWMSARSGFSGELLRLMRSTQHARADVLLTTQHFTGDVPQAALSCATDVLVFRSTAPAVLRTLEREYGIDRRTAATLAQGQYLHHETGF